MRLHTGAVQQDNQDGLHWKLSLGEKNLAARGTRTRVSIAPGFSVGRSLCQLNCPCPWLPDESIATNAVAARKMVWQWWPDKEQCHKHGLCDRVMLGGQYLQCCQRHRCLYDGVIRIAKQGTVPQTPALIVWACDAGWLNNHNAANVSAACASLWCCVAPQPQRRQRQRSMCEFMMLCGSTITMP